jgi:hypothetical protein
MRPVAICWKTSRIILRRPWRTGDRSVNCILLCGFGTFYYDLLHMSFESRYELRDWCKARLQQLINLVYVEEQRHKAEEEKRLAHEVELKRRRETPETWEHYKAQCDEANRRAREANVGV